MTVSLAAWATRGSAPDNWGWAVVFVVVLAALAFSAMWWGWRRRGARHDLPPLPRRTAMPERYREARGRYFGSTVHDDWLDRVVAQGLGNRSEVSLRLSSDGVEVVRPNRGSFFIPAAALVGAGTASGIAGKVIPPAGVLLVTWTHGDLTLDSGFRLADGGHQEWVEAIDKLAKEHA